MIPYALTFANAFSGDASSSGRAASRAGQGEQLLMRPLPILVVGEEKKRELATYVPPPKRRASTYLNDLERQNPTKLARIDVAPDHGSAQEALGHIKTEVEDEAMSTLDYGRSPTPPPPGARARYGQDHRTSGRPTPDCGVSIASYLRAQSLIGQPKSGYLVDRTVQSIQDQMNSYVCDSGPYETFQLLQVVDKKFNIDKKQWRGITEMQYKLDNLRRERVQKELSLGRNANREGQEALRLDTRATQGAREELRLDRLTDQGPRKELRGARLHVQGGQQASSLPVRGPVHAMAPPLMVLALPRLGMSPQGLDLAGTIMDEANHLLRQYSNVQLALSFQDMGDIVGLRRGPIN
jgi:hypothetical protein